PRAIRADMFPLANDGGSAGMYGWPAVQEDRNNTGWLSPAVPGMPACMLTALGRFGRLTPADVIAPAIRLAADGVPVDWNLVLTVVSTAERINRFSATRDTFFRKSGMPLAMPSFSGPGDTLRQPDLADTLDLIARGGVGAFYEGE